MFQQLPPLPQGFRSTPAEYLTTAKKVNDIYHAQQTMGLAMLSNATWTIKTLNEKDTPALYPGCPVELYLRHVRGECAQMYDVVLWYLDAACIHFSNASEARIYAGYTFFGGIDRRHQIPINMLTAEKDSISIYAEDFKQGAKWVFDVYQRQRQFPAYAFVDRRLATGQTEIVFPEECFVDDPVYISEEMDVHVEVY